MQLKSQVLNFLFLLVASISSAQGSYTIREAALQTGFTSPFNLLPDSADAPPTVINMLKWNENPQDPPAPKERYNRLMQFGTWIVPPGDKTSCSDVRNLVLIRESSEPVQMRNKNHCKVYSGEWYDPYTDKNYKSAFDVQIDHFVPLKDAYKNGAWKWNFQARCTYANYMGFRDHLKPVNGNENMKKSDSAPISYMPPNTSYRCEYLKIWLSIKLIWKLGMQRDEANGIKELLAQEKCNSADFVFKSKELREQRKLIQASLALCPEVPPAPEEQKEN